MANHVRPATRSAIASAATAGLPLADHAPRSGITYEYDVPHTKDDPLHDEVTHDFGSIRTVIVRLLTPQEERAAAQSIGQDFMALPAALARRSIVGVIDEKGNQRNVADHDGTSDMLWAQMHPKIRGLVSKVYADNHVTSEKTTESFVASRRVRA